MRSRRPWKGDHPPSRARFALLVHEALSGIMQRPGRAALTALGTTLGIGTFVAVLGITSTANGQITAQFNRLTATEVDVRQVGDAAPGPDSLLFPLDAEQRAARIEGVTSAAVHWTVDGGLVRRLPLSAGGADQDHAIRVVAATSGVWNVSQARVRQGRVFDAFTGTQPVAVLGRSVATKLGIRDLAVQPFIYVDDHPFLVIGIIEEPRRVDDLANAITVPARTALDLWGRPVASPQMTVRTRLGAATVVARQLPTALDPVHPDWFSAEAPAEPRVLRNNVSADLRSLFLLLSLICLVVGAVGIATANLISVMERVPEIGIRRSLGAMPRHIGTQFLIESTVLGALGGLVGSVVGGSSVLVIAAARHWTPIVAPWTVVTAPVLGSAVGLLAGLYPALRAARIEPVEAFRR